MVYHEFKNSTCGLSHTVYLWEHYVPTASSHKVKNHSHMQPQSSNKQTYKQNWSICINTTVGEKAQGLSNMETEAST